MKIKKELKEYFKWLIFSTVAVLFFLFAMWIMCTIIESASMIGLVIILILLFSIALYVSNRNN